MDRLYDNTPDWRALDAPCVPDPAATVVRAMTWVVAVGLLAGLLLFLTG